MKIALYYHVAPFKKEIKRIRVKYLIYAVLSRFKFVVIYAFFPQNLYSKSFRVHKKMVFSKSNLLLGYLNHLFVNLNIRSINAPMLNYLCYFFLALLKLLRVTPKSLKGRGGQ